jgi:hypothetical protein
MSSGKNVCFTSISNFSGSNQVGVKNYAFRWKCIRNLSEFLIIDNAGLRLGPPLIACDSQNSSHPLFVGVRNKPMVVHYETFLVSRRIIPLPFPHQPIPRELGFTNDHRPIFVPVVTFFFHSLYRYPPR